MKLAQNEWMMVGAGKLFCAPFLSRVLLYRLHDIKCAFLIYHDTTYIASTVDHADLPAEARELPAGFNLGNVVVATQLQRNPRISVHCCAESSSVPFEELVNLPAKRIRFEDCKSHMINCDKVTFRIEQIILPYSKRLFVVAPDIETTSFMMEGSGFTVTGPVKSSYWPDEVPIDKGRMGCWRVCLNCVGSEGMREFSECTHWSVAALDVTVEGKIQTTVYLESNDDRSQTPTVASLGS
jgi:hypothetical protein